MRTHEKEVLDALYKYWNKVLEESGHLNTFIEMGKKKHLWFFEIEETVGTFVFTYENIEVYATPYWEFSEGIPFAIYQNGEVHRNGTLPIITTGNLPNDTDTYISIIGNLITLYEL